MSKNLNLSVVYAAVLVLIFALGAFAQTARFLPVKQGETAPDFTLKANDGTQVTLSEAVKEGPVVLVFYRGYWCPYCVGQLRELRGLLTETEKTRIYAVSIDPINKTNQLIQFIESKDKIKFKYTFLADPKAKTIDTYGLRDPEYKSQEFDGIPYPTVYLIGTDRKVVWSKLEKNFKDRPTNKEIRTQIDKLKVE